jgi:hypothetical protein
MVWDRSLALRRSRRTGWKIVIATGVAAVLFLWGLTQESYWALALPVTGAVLTGLSLAFYIGYTILTVRGIPPEADQYDSKGAKWAALGICAGSVIAGCIFLAGVIAQSYWAIALPVAGAVFGLLGMIFWIGMAIVMQKTTLTQARSSASAVPGAASMVSGAASTVPGVVNAVPGAVGNPRNPGSDKPT